MSKKKEQELEILKVKFQSLENAISLDLDEFDVARAVMEYARFVGSSSFVSSVVNELAKERLFNQRYLFELFWHGLIWESLRNFKLKSDKMGMPLYFDKEIEEIYGLFASFQRLLFQEDKRMKEAKKQSISVEEIVLAEDAEEERLNEHQRYHGMQIIHGQILERANEHLSRDSQTGTEQGKAITIPDAVQKKLECAKMWEHVHFEFCSDKDRVDILISGTSCGIFHFDDLGFSSQRHKQELKAVAAWQNMKVLGLTDGRLHGDDAHAIKRGIKIQLCALFPHLIGDPFELLGNANYKIKCIILDKNIDREDYKERNFLLQ